MLGKRQFSLGYLLLEMLWVSLAIGFSCKVAAAWQVPVYDDAVVIVNVCSLIAGLACWGAAIGGLFGRMIIGAVTALAAFVTWFAMFAPRVQ
jgi:hypothetical protein